MADIATLGLEVRSDQVRKGTADLEKLSGAARRAEAASKGLTTGTRGANAAAAAVSGSANAAAGALNREAAAATQAAKALDMHARAANQNVRGLQKANVGNIAAQLQDVAVSAQMGMGALQIGLQQGTQLAAVIAAMDNPIRGLGQAFVSVISPVSLLTIGLISLAAAGLQAVDWAKLAASTLNAFASALNTIAPYATAASAALALIYAPSIIVGLIHLIALIARVGLAATVAGAQMAAAWLVGLGPIGMIIAGVAAIGAAAYLLRDQIKSAIGVDVVAVMKAAGNYIINSFEAAYSDVKFVWSNFGDMMGAAVVGGVNIAIRAIDGLIKRATDGIDQLIRAINPYIEMAGMEGLSEIGGSLGIKELDNPYADRFGKANAGHAGEIERIMGQDRLGQFGAAIGEGASAASDKLRELADWMTKVDEKAGKKRGKTEAEKSAERYDDILRGSEQFIAAQMLEQEALGMTEQAANALRYEQEMLAQAANDNIKLTPAMTAEIKSYAIAMAAAEAETKRLRDAMEFAKEITGGFIEDFRSGIEQGKSIWESFANAALNALDKIVDKLLNEVLDALFQVNQSGAGSGGGILGFLGNLLGGFGGGSAPFVNTPGVGLYAEGGYTGPGGKHEPAGTVHRGEYVFSAAATKALGVLNLDRMHRRAKSGYAEGGYVGGSSPMAFANNNSRPAANGNLHVTIGWSRTADGNLTPFIESIAEQKATDAAGQAVAKNNVRMPDMVQSINRDPRKRVGGLK